jgi:type II secretory pathway pseudopilin PulG
MIIRRLKKMKTGESGFSRIEILVSIVILGIIVVPVCQGIVNSVAINRASKDILQARLSVSSAVETLMAEGVQYKVDGEGKYIEDSEQNTGEERFPGLKVSVTPKSINDETKIPAYYEVKVEEVTDADDVRTPISLVTRIHSVEYVEPPAP